MACLVSLYLQWKKFCKLSNIILYSNSLWHSAFYASDQQTVSLDTDNDTNNREIDFWVPNATGTTYVQRKYFLQFLSAKKCCEFVHTTEDAVQYYGNFVIIISNYILCTLFIGLSL